MCSKYICARITMRNLTEFVNNDQLCDDWVYHRYYLSIALFIRMNSASM